VTNEPPAGCYYYDRFCDRQFSNLDDYTNHLDSQITRNDQIVNQDSDDTLRTLGFVDGYWVSSDDASPGRLGRKRMGRRPRFRGRTRSAITAPNARLGCSHTAGDSAVQIDLQIAIPPLPLCPGLRLRRTPGPARGWLASDTPEEIIRTSDDSDQSTTDRGKPATVRRGNFGSRVYLGTFFGRPPVNDGAAARGALPIANQLLMTYQYGATREERFLIVRALAGLAALAV
jgi:hypothetical protein